ncbi:unnamed protein product [Scytosiphon promiscuus]
MAEMKKTGPVLPGAQKPGAAPTHATPAPKPSFFAGTPSPLLGASASPPGMSASAQGVGGASKTGATGGDGGGDEGEGGVGGGGGVKAKGKGKGVDAGGAGKGKGGGMSSAGKGDASAAATISSKVGGGGGGDRYNWMPSLCRSKPSRECIRRVRNDIRSVMRDPVPGLFVYPDEDLVTVVHALVTGPFDTPYEGGFYYFVLHCPDDYPHSPPRVRLMTTGGGTVRFNPNLYADGKVCLSILGTWEGPRWTPVHSISSVLLSIQSLMNEKPYHNEPGFEAASNPQDVRDYNDCITHENLRVAVCSMVDDSSLWKSMPACFQTLTRDLFLSFVPRYGLVCEQNMHRDGQELADPFRQNKGTFCFAQIDQSIKRIATMLEAAGGEDVAESSPHDKDDGTRST